MNDDGYTRHCPRCNKTKLLSAFNDCQPYCKACMQAYGKEWRASHPEKLQEYTVRHAASRKQYIEQIKAAPKQEVGIKHCRHCLRDLPTTEFSKNNSAPDGLQAYCKDCRRQIQNRYQ